MTKKSESRQKRDQMATQMESENLTSSYDQVEQMYASQIVLFPEYTKLVLLLINPEIIGFLRDPVTCANRVRALSAEVKDLRTRTEDVRSRHAAINKRDADLNEDEHMESIMIFQEYAMLQGIHQQNVLPLMLELQEHLSQAIQTKEAIQAQAVAESTPVQTTDVVEAPVLVQ